MLIVTKEWRAFYPGAMMGVLAVENVINPPTHGGLEQEKKRLERQLREKYASSSREDLLRLPVMLPYVEYYRKFKKTYHVLLQLESVAKAGKPLPRTAALVEAMFIAELRNLLLTAGHDLDSLRGSPVLDIARGTEKYTLIGGNEAALKPNDMLVRDDEGVISSVIYGPDGRTRIAANTRRAIFTVYAPAGIPKALVEHHLDDLEANVRIISPKAGVLEKRVYS